MDLEKFFNNQSVGAFLGAFAAFILVVLNDWRRERRKAKGIKAEFDVCLGHAKAKLDTVREMLSLAKNYNAVAPAPVMPFNTVIIRQLTAESIDKLTNEQRRSIDGICYRMEATDGLLHDIYQLARQLSGFLKHEDRSALAERLLLDLQDGIVNLKILCQMLENYAAEKYGAVLDTRYNRTDFQE